MVYILLPSTTKELAPPIIISRKELSGSLVFLILNLALFYIFDIIYYNGENVSQMPFSERLTFLQKITYFGEIKPFFRLGSKSSSNIQKLEKLKRPYETDGIIFTIDGENYFVGFMESNGNITPADLEMQINKDHIQILKECLEPPVLGEEMYDFKL